MPGNGKGKGEASKAEGLPKAFDRAWEDAHGNGAPTDTPLDVKIQIVGENPIRSYIVIVDPDG
jgi:hypothetical protein